MVYLAHLPDWPRSQAAEGALLSRSPSREHLTGGEVEKLMKAARNGGRYGHRDATLILVAYRHGFRATEICDLEWSQVEWGRIVLNL
jgi:integrase